MCILKNNSHISFCVHIGSSMNPLLQEFDILEIKSYKNRQICTGDIIYFQLPKKYELPGKSADIVHRIVKIDSKGIYTKGDNSKNKDPWVLNHDNIYGRVTGVLRSDRYRKIPGSWMGKIQGFVLGQYCVWILIVSKI
ncbi:Signal peptidase S26 domain-containing protein [Desulfonema limicola]|uniref:Signal peptidase S26 domain-containing protein n=1 Tax=Desulfonema limicola TaxID=45656 RepID=A0A975B5Q1_9BACT|nr:S26 family signal peptidase [Desulfonema limicola]QTA79263.1 Signal peptidase S26 domain-containing protein [Desulfonema limicola]